MKKISLMVIEESIHEYAYLLSNILKLDVEIGDCNFYRVSGIGIFKDKICENIYGNGYVFKETIRTKNSQIVYEPGKDEICNGCNKKLL